jgi:hypothetical protein
VAEIANFNTDETLRQNAKGVFYYMNLIVLDNVSYFFLRIPFF